MQAVEQAGVLRIAGAAIMAHAALRARQRGITDDEIRETLCSPDRTYPARANKWVSLKYLAGRRIKAVWVMEDGQQVVITLGDRDLDDDGRTIWKD